MSSDPAVLDRLRKACGDDRARAAGESDAVDGVPAAAVAAPADQDGVAEVLRCAAQDGLTVVPRGAGTKLTWGCPPSTVDLVIDVSALDSVLEHAAGDLVVRVQPGVKLTELAGVLATAGQRLAIDEVVPGSTVGGVISTALTGPSRLLYGTIRDLLIGITVVRADGAVTHSGGKVVKNVAGYDLGKLYAGAFGTLGVITEAIFRLHPLPETAAWVGVELPDAAAAAAPVAGVLDSQTAPTAVEVSQPAPDGAVTVAVLLEGLGAGVEARAATISSLLGAGARVNDQQPSWWSRLPGPTTIKLTAETATVPRVLTGISAAAAAGGLTPDVRGSAGVGVLYAGLPADADPAAVAGFVEALRTLTAGAGGSTVVLTAPAAVRTAVDPWGPVPALALMRRLKDQFDPDHRLAPGRFVGGI
ncbi:MAG: FAD-binding oxidoreductase [Actinomycetota bacterium]|nr:FAD-binding oxidoreductase [Actinomycetota bacterium]